MDRFQGKCWVNDEGWKYMDMYDSLPPNIRRRLANSPFNLCPFCVIHQLAVSNNFGYTYEYAIASLENMVRSNHG